LFVVDQNESRLILFEGRHLKGLNPDERAIAGWLRKKLRSPNNSGLRVISREIDQFLREFSTIFVLAREGTPIYEVSDFPSGALFTVGSHHGYSEKDKKVLEAQGGQLISLGRQEYLSSTTIAILQWTLDRHLLER
jgi:tRNA pseudouridine-54 N-methylase